MGDTTYNGWANYATWRVNLEIFDGHDPEGFDFDQGAYRLGKDLREYAEQLIEDSSIEGPARDYALAFLRDVDWTEIAAHMIDVYIES